MTTETMTITRALAEVKHLKNRFDRSLADSRFVALAQGQDDAKRLFGDLGLVPIAQFETSAKAAIQGCEDQLKRYRAIRRALIAANATTNVTIGKETMTIAEAIERKGSIALDIQLLNTLRHQYTQAQSANSQLEQRLQETIERSVLQLYGNDRTKITEEQTKVVSDAKRREFAPSLVDPISIVKRIEALTASIEDFTNEVNYVLSEANASTKITVEY